MPIVVFDPGPMYCSQACYCHTNSTFDLMHNLYTLCMQNNSLPPVFQFSSLPQHKLRLTILTLSKLTEKHTSPNCHTVDFPCGRLDMAWASKKHIAGIILTPNCLQKRVAIYDKLLQHSDSSFDHQPHDVTSNSCHKWHTQICTKQQNWTATAAIWCRWAKWPVQYTRL